MACTMHCRKYKEKCAKRFYETTCAEINGCDTPMVPGSVVSAVGAPETEEEKQQLQKKHPGNFHEFAGALLFGVHGCGPQYLSGLSQLQRNSNNPSEEHWQAMHRLMKTWLSRPDEGITAVRQTEVFRMDRAFGSFDAAFACKKEVLEYMAQKDITLCYPRVCGVICFNQMPLSMFACRYKAVLSSTSAAETAALALGVQKANFILKLLSYLTPGDPKTQWAHTPPQARDGVPILCEQDNKGCIAFAFNPVSTGRLINMVISQAVIREAIELNRVLPFKVPTGQMVSNVGTKNETPKVYRRQVAQLIGDLPWESIQSDDSRFQPTWCVYCSTSDVESQFDEATGMWVGVCNLCSGIIR